MTKGGVKIIGVGGWGKSLAGFEGATKKKKNGCVL